MRDERAGFRREAIRLFALAALVVGGISTPMLAFDGGWWFFGDETKGEISIARPKVWQYERVEALMDGLLRDIEGVSLKDLTLLDPNAQNATAIRFVQSMFELNTKFDQADLVKNQNARAVLDDHNQHTGVLRQQRTRLTSDLFTANNVVNSLLRKKASEGLNADEEQRLASAQANAEDLKKQLDQVDALITSAGEAPTAGGAQALSSTNADAVGTTALSFGQFLASLPDDFKKAIGDGLKQPNYPATRQLDNFLLLLRERLAAEISVLQDDVARDPTKSAFLVQFDVGLYPHKSAKNYMATVEFELADCANCSVYSLYPAQSSYNVANYSGTSSNSKFKSLFSTLLGIGVNASFQRQVDALHSSLVQSVYVSGFQDGSKETGQRFGWRYNAAPFEEYVSPGIRSTFAIITMPRETADHFKLNTAYGWSKRTDPVRPSLRKVIEAKVPEASRFDRQLLAVEKDPRRMHVLRFEYNPVYYSPTEGTVPVDPLTACPRKQCSAVLVRTDLPVDANLIITVRGRPLRRVRDWRGRATSILPPAQTGVLAGAMKPSTRSLTEVDQLEADSWYQVNSHEILLNISRDLAGSESFPAITLSDPARRAVLIPYDLRRDQTELVMSGFRLVPRSALGVQNYARGLSSERESPRPLTDQEKEQRAPLLSGAYPYSTFLPLFLPNPTTQRIFAFVGETGQDLLIGRLDNDRPAGTIADRTHWLETRTRVILEDRELDFAWSLVCATQDPLLACELPLDVIRETYLNFAAVCRTQKNCPAAWISVRQVATPAMQPHLETLDFRANATPSARPPGPISLSSLQVWVEQYDPDGKVGLESVEPATLPFFPLDPVNDNPNIPMRFEQYDRLAGTVTLKQCGPLSALVKTVTLLGAYTSPSTFDPKRTPPDDAKCFTITVPLIEFSRTALILNINATGDTSRFILPVPTSLVLPHLGDPIVSANFNSTASRPTVSSWDIEWPASRTACGDSLDLPAAMRLAGAVASWRAATAENATPCGITRWDDYDRSGQARLHLRVPRAALPFLPDSLSLFRSDERQSTSSPSPNAVFPSLKVGSLEVANLLRPTGLTLEPLGREGFALSGVNAEQIDAIIAQRDGNPVRIPTSVSGAYAHVSMETQKPGTYVILPLMRVGTVDIPLPSAASKPLVYIKTKPEEPPKTEPEGDKTTTKTTITRTTEISKKPANATPAAPAKPVVPPK